MKQPKKLTREQKKVLSQNGLVPENWMVCQEDNISFTVINKKTKSKRGFLK